MAILYYVLLSQQLPAVIYQVMHSVKHVGNMKMSQKYGLLVTYVTHGSTSLVKACYVHLKKKYIYVIDVSIKILHDIFKVNPLSI